MTTDYETFRRELDRVLVARDPAALRAFMIERGEWPADTTTDPTRALWLMIATSSSLVALHGEALAWLRNQGYSAEADALSGRGPKGKR
jgi:N-glycosylase/DNA lyase